MVPEPDGPNVEVHNPIYMKDYVDDEAEEDVTFDLDGKVGSTSISLLAFQLCKLPYLKNH